MPISYDVPFRDYLTTPGVHFSALREMARSPLHYRRAVGHERADTAALRVGRATHALILTPEIADVAVFDGPVRRGKAWEEFRAAAEAKGQTNLRAEELRAAECMRDAVYANATARELLREGAPEVTVTWGEDLNLYGEPMTATWGPRTVPCRARLDWLGCNGLVELKTTRWTTPRSWAREVASRSYHVQLAHYVAGLERHDRDASMPVHWIVVENVPPHDVAVYHVRREDIEAGERLRLTWLRRVAECEASGRWPGVGGDGPIEFVLPEYATGLDDVEVEGLEGEENG